MTGTEWEKINAQKLKKITNSNEYITEAVGLENLILVTL